MRKNTFILIIGIFILSLQTFAQCNINGLQSDYCVGDDPVILSGNLPGGIFSGPGVSNSVFDPAIAGVGTHQIQYINTSSYVISQMGVFAPLAAIGTAVYLRHEAWTNGWRLPFWLGPNTQVVTTSSKDPREK